MGGCHERLLYCKKGGSNQTAMGASVGGQPRGLVLLVLLLLTLTGAYNLAGVGGGAGLALQRQKLLLGPLAAVRRNSLRKLC